MNQRMKTAMIHCTNQLSRLQAGLALSVVIAAHAALPATTVHAQAMAIEEVIVTARKREQSMQDVSVAVSALSENILKDAQIVSSEELASLVPSLNVQRAGGPRESSFNIRGIGTQSFSSGVEPSVSTVVDGVVMGRSGMAFMQMLDVQRVEVLRGPQGTLFGKNSSGGVIHIISQQPTEEFEAEVMATAIEQDEYRAGFSVAGPLSDSLGYRVTGSGRKDDGYIENEFDGQTLNDIDEWSLRGKLRWQPSDTLDIVWSSDINRYDSNCCVAPLRSIDPFAGATDAQLATQQAVLTELLPVVPSDENDRVNLNYNLDFEDLDGDGRNDVNISPSSDSKGSGHALQLDWDVGDHTLTSITAYREWEEFGSPDADSRPTTPFSVQQEGASDQEQFTQEFRLTSSADQFVSYVLGVYYFDQEISRRFERFIINGSGIANFTVDTLNYAGFGEATVNVSERVRLIAGGRYTHDEVEFDFMQPSDSGFVLNVEPFSKKVTEDDFSIKLAAEWDVTEEALTYLSYVEGYKGPAFNVVFGSTQGNTFPVDPETADAYELGFKSSWLDRRLIVNVAMFYTEYQDFQAQTNETTFVLDEDGNRQDVDMNGEDDFTQSSVLQNVGEVSTAGLEIDFVAQATENLSLFGGVAFIEAEIEEFNDGPCNEGQKVRGVGFNGQTSCAADPDDVEVPQVQDLSGGELPQSPDWKLTLAANYRIPLESAPFDVVLKGNYRVQDEVQFGIQQDEFTVQDSYDVLDLSVVLEDKDQHYTVTAFVKNVLDEFYVSHIASTNLNLIPNGYTHRVPKTAQRTAGLEFRYNWY